MVTEGFGKIYAEQMEENYPDKYVIRRLTKTNEQYTEALKARVTERRDSIKKEGKENVIWIEKKS